MEEIICGNCSKPIPQTPGKRKKEFCNSTCRSNNWQKEKRRNATGLKPPKLLLQIQDLTTGNTNQVKPIEPPRTQNVVINTGEREPKEGSMAFFSKYGVSTYAELNNKNGKPKQ